MKINKVSLKFRHGISVFVAEEFHRADKIDMNTK